jgi:hypothetical protein
MNTLRCEAIVEHRDDYRVSRKGGSRRFRMHYRKEQCKRSATDGTYCRQHAKAFSTRRCPWLPAPMSS